MQSNGMELGDPCCTWTNGATPTRTVLISDPSQNSSRTTAAAVSCGAGGVPVRAAIPYLQLRHARTQSNQRNGLPYIFE